jgi:hypothetical protein
MKEIEQKAKEYAERNCYSHERAMGEISFLAGYQCAQEWMSVEKDGYPPHLVGVLVFIPKEDYHVTSGMWDISNKWVLLDEYRVPDCEVTHWMKLPGVPKEFEKEIDDNAKVMGWLNEALKSGKLKR